MWNDLCPVEDDQSDEAVGFVKASGRGADLADGGVVRLGDSVGELPSDGRFDGHPVVADGAGQFHEGDGARP